MAGGTWTTQNKIRPGAYINFESAPVITNTFGERGTVTMPLAMSWGDGKKIIRINAGDDVTAALGYDINAPQLLLIKEALKEASTLLLYRLNYGTNATATMGALTATADNGGLRGNDITVRVAVNVDDTDQFDVTTFVSGNQVDKQTAATVEDLTNNQWVRWTGTGALTATAGTPLTGGADGTVTAQDYLDYIAAIEVEDWNTMGVNVTDDATKSVFTSFVRRMREGEGKRVQVVLANSTADYEGVINVESGYVLSDGTEVPANQATAWVAGATAGASVNESNTYKIIQDAVNVTPRLSNTQIESALQRGAIVFSILNGNVVVEKDINSLHTFTDDKGRDFSKNRVLRVMDGIGDTFKNIFSTSFIGKVTNNERGRDILKSQYINYLRQLEAIEAIEDFSPDDLVLSQGVDKDSVVSDLGVKILDAMEKQYMTVTVRA